VIKVNKRIDREGKLISRRSSSSVSGTFASAAVSFTGYFWRSAEMWSISSDNVCVESSVGSPSFGPIDGENLSD